MSRAHGQRSDERVGTGEVGVVLLAAGSGTRTGSETNKVLFPLGGRHVLTWSLDATTHLPDVARTIVVTREEDQPAVHRVLEKESPHREAEVITGGRTRHGSEWHALKALAPDIESGAVDVVVIHDAARPLAGTALFLSVIDTARAYGGAIPVTRRDDLVFAADGRHAGPLVAVQTPQAFAALPLLEAYRAARAVGFEGTDTAACIERFTGLSIRGVTSDARNIKITYPEDLVLAERLLARRTQGL